MEKKILKDLVPYENGMRAVFALQVFFKGLQAVMGTAGLESWSFCVEAYIFNDRHCGVLKVLKTSVSKFF